MSRNRDRRRPSRDAGCRRSRPRIEGLEDRLLLFATNGGEWAHPVLITYSFAPDGTDVGGTPSNLDAALATRGYATQAWRDQFRRAFASWQVAANVNFVEVTDDGSPLSASGNQQNDPRFGDIRIAGVAGPAGLLGTAFLPPQLNGGTLAGDILLNSSAIWNVNSDYDLRTVALHEVGHSLGLDHATSSSAVMAATYTGVKQSPMPDDVAGVRSLYGPRQADPLEGATDNNVPARATPITGLIDAQQQVRVAGLDITTSGDTDYFYVVAPAGGSGQMSVTMQSSGLSSLGPRVQVYSAGLAGLGQATSTEFGGTVTVTIAGVRPGQGFYVRAMASGGGAVAGAYGLIVNFGGTAATPIEPPDTTVPEQPSLVAGSADALRIRNSIAHVQLGALHGYGDILLDARRLRGNGPQLGPDFLAPAIEMLGAWIQAPRRDRTLLDLIDAVLDALGSLDD